MILPGDPDQFRVNTPAEAVAGEDFPAQIEALDRFGNLIEDYDLRGLEVYLSADGRGKISPEKISPASFVRGKAAVSLLYNRAESFSVVAALSKEALEKLIAERKRQAAAPPAPVVSPEDAAREQERVSAIKAREEAQRAKDEAEKHKTKDEAVKAREDAQRARDEAEKKRAAAKERAEAERIRDAAAPAARPGVNVLEKVTIEEGKGLALARLLTSGPVSYKASTGSQLSKEWIWIELYPARMDASVGKRTTIPSKYIGEVTIEQTEPEKVRVSLQVIPPGISYVVTQQDRSVVVKVVRTE